ncbi:MAG: peptidase domain-containing ABC transporter, partial [Chloroflexota bacterium]|nr:peptidase domain-containing ABC transporter [Chloroflexota bacterium]
MNELPPSTNPKGLPSRPNNQPAKSLLRPPSFFNDINGVYTPETPPHIPTIENEDIDKADTMIWPAITMRHSLLEESDVDIQKRLAAQNRLTPPKREVNYALSDYETQLLPVVKVAKPDAKQNNAAGQPVYGNTSYERRLARKKIIEERKLSWQDLQQFSQFITPFKWQIALAFFLTVGIGLTSLPLPFIFHTMLDQVFPRKDISLFIWLLAILLAVFTLTELLTYLNSHVVGSLTRAANLKIIYRFYHHMLRLPLSFYDGLSSTGQVLSRLNEVTSAQQTVIQVIIDTVVNSVLAVIYLGVLFYTDWRMTLSVIVVGPFYVGVSFYFNRRMRKFSRNVLESYATMNGAMYEGLTGLKTVKALAAEHRFGRKTKVLVMKTNQLSFRRSIFQAEANVAIGFVQALCTIAILSFGGYLVLTRAMTAGQLAAFILILRQLSSPIATLNGVNQQLQASAVAIDRLFEILNAPEEADAEKGIQIANVHGDITLDHVSFSYTPGIEVLHDLSLHVKAGTTIAFVGRSGAGKTTLSNLLMRFYQPDSGQITIDGYDLRDLKIEHLRSQFGVILQDDSLFSGTIEENLVFGLLRKISLAEMEEAARNANILDFIESQPLGFKTVLRERGQSLSGGQRQRLSIARMFLRQPKILIMDEPSSALDNESEVLIQQALKRLTQGRTTFIIAHRLSTIRHADRIVVVDKGRVTEQGSHEELLQHKGIYWHLYN